MSEIDSNKFFEVGLDNISTFSKKTVFAVKITQQMIEDENKIDRPRHTLQISMEMRLDENVKELTVIYDPFLDKRHYHVLMEWQFLLLQRLN